MGFKSTLDLTSLTSREAIEAGELIPAGWHRAILSEHTETGKTPGEYQFEFTVNGGPFDGRKTWYRFMDPEVYGDEKKARTAANRIQMLASRLGLIADNNLGQPGCEIDFDSAVGREFVLSIENNSYDETDRETGEKTGNKKHNTRITYSGIYPLNHHSIPESARKALNLPPAASGSNSVAPASAPPSPAKKSKARDFSDL